MPPKRTLSPRVALAFTAATTPSSRAHPTFESRTAAVTPRGWASSPRLLAYVDVLLCSRETTRRGLVALRSALAVATCLSLVLGLAASVGLLSWYDLFPRKAHLYDAVRDCRTVRTGREAPCSNVFESACFDRSRCPGLDGGVGGGESLSVYVHDDMCSMRSSSNIVANYRRGAVPKMWSQAAEAFRQVAATRYVIRGLGYLFDFFSLQWMRSKLKLSPFASGNMKLLEKCRSLQGL